MKLPSSAKDPRLGPAEVRGLYITMGFAVNRYEMDIAISIVFAIITVAEWSSVAGIASMVSALITLATMRGQHEGGGLWTRTKKKEE